MANPVYADVRQRDGHMCRACLSRDRTEVHHIIFRSHGGVDSLGNLILLCKLCHMRAHNTEPDYIAPWELQLMIQLKAAGLRGLRLNLAANRSCTSCERRTEQWACMLWEHDVDEDYVCPEWKERDAGTLIELYRIHPKSLR